MWKKANAFFFLDLISSSPSFFPHDFHRKDTCLAKTSSMGYYIVIKTNTEPAMCDSFLLFRTLRITRESKIKLWTLCSL